MSIFFNRNSDLITIIIHDATNRKVGSWKFETSNKKLANSIMKHIADKYGFKPEISNEEAKKVNQDFLDLNPNW